MLQSSPVHPSSIFLFVHPSMTLKDVMTSFLWRCTFVSGTYFLRSDTDKDFFYLSHTASPTLSAFYAPLSAPNALLLLNYFTVPLASVDCEKCVWCKGPLTHVLMDLEKSSQCWDMWLIVPACSLPEQQGHTGAAGGEGHFDLLNTSPPHRTYPSIHNIYQVHTHLYFYYLLYVSDQYAPYTAS